MNTTKSRILSRTAHDGDCLLWTGCRSKRNGYGFLNVNGRNSHVHRLMYQEAIGSIPEGMCVLHKCDRPHCVNPAHLFLGTHADNIADKVAKNRQAKGSRHGLAKLTEKIVHDIRLAYASGTRPRVLASTYGVDRTVIHNVVSRKTWKHVI